ncbi:MAG TPA: ATP-binding cassette domain-containing protein [Aquabacterium sp.]|uniref:ABC transporter ATP-binding protein n=1 Tax=Aquabacterium sp. TaxID=1872578 RepID=UPI002E2EDD5B|nr:ATP-binding cassette domain-containing protein [Aquabacterium sp.]HEX5371795.1 ATP-binding cassette domain-containing protein [Aquabacterium sp.]
MIDLLGLSLRYPQGPTLHFDDAHVPQGHTLILRGDSGSGKSTLLAILAGLLPPSQGQARVAGVAPHELPPAKRDRWRGATIGLLPQRALLSPHLSVWQHLALPYVCAGDTPDPAAIERTLRALALLPQAERLAHTLSGGQAQRVALGRALVRQPAVLLADEPTASLDDTHTHQVLALLQAQAGRATIVIATHDARAVHHLSGRPEVQTLQLATVSASTTPGAWA